MISKRLIQNGYPQIKADHLHFNLIVIVSIQTKSARVHTQNNKRCVTVQLIMVLTVYKTHQSD